MWIYFMPAIDSWNEARRGVEEGLMIFPDEGTEAGGRGDAKPRRRVAQ